MVTTSREYAILLICSDHALTRRYIAGLMTVGGPHQIPLAANFAHAQRLLEKCNPRVILLDESAIQQSGEELEIIVGVLTQHAPVVVVADDRSQQLDFLVNAGAVDMVPRKGSFTTVAAESVARRAELAASLPDAAPEAIDPDRDFGELLRHEVNNPLTGILGNAELLLKHREGLSTQVIARVETIAELAVRLRETIRRLTDHWESRHDPARIASHKARSPQRKRRTGSVV